MSVDQSLAGTSDAATVAAMAVYTAAMLAFVVDLATAGRRSPERVAVAAGHARGHVAGSENLPHADPVVDRDAAAPGRSRAGGVAVALFVLAAAAHLVAVTARGLAAGRVPWSNAYEFALTGSLAVAAVALGMIVRRRNRWIGAFVTLPVLLTLGLATAVFYAETTALAPALQSFWLVIHVSVAFIASAIFTVSFSLSVLQLVQHRADDAVARGGTRPRPLRALPTADALEGSAFRLNAVAFVLWSFTVIAGAIWAEHAWGRYWGWDPKEVWSLVIWVVYAGYLHARVTAGWGGRRAAWLAVAGYACLLFNFFGVNYLFSGLHSYA
jgi:cytochrome c-type biogenesis protein CcsB